MYKSREIRWFRDSVDADVVDWFDGKGQHFGNTAPRTDFYMPLKRSDMTSKLREGNIEVKYRIAGPEERALTPGAIGWYEEWIKYSFRADTRDKLSNEIISLNPYGWQAVVKTRLGVKVFRDESENMAIVPIREEIPSGCQIEYTRLVVNGNVWYSFALEWFGEAAAANVPTDLFESILGRTNYLRDESMGYGQFLEGLAL